MLRGLLDKVEPYFHKGGPLEKLYPLYEANDTFLYTPDEVAKGQTHVRDAIDTKRMMSMVIVALIPCIFMAMYNTGYQAQKIIAGQGSAFEIPESIWGSWRYSLMSALGIGYNADPGGFLSFGSMFRCMFHGSLYFIPVYGVCMFVGGHCEVLFSVVRKHEINEGFLVTGMLFPLTLPPDIPLWQVAVGIAFGVIVGKEIFGGTGKNFLNPALTARAFLSFAYPKQISGNSVWTSVDGLTGATALGAIADAKPDVAILAERGDKVYPTVSEVVTGIEGKYEKADVMLDFSWWDSFIGNIHGSMGETSTLACLIGAAILILSRIGSWRIMAGVAIGVASFSSLLCIIPMPETVYNITPQWHFVIGGLAFGAVFMATDPVSASLTRKGKWIYGFLIGFMTVLVRTVNPAFPEGIMLAILFGNVMAPLIDYFVLESNIKRRLARDV